MSEAGVSPALPATAVVAGASPDPALGAKAHPNVLSADDQPNNSNDTCSEERRGKGKRTASDAAEGELNEGNNDITATADSEPPVKQRQVEKALPPPIDVNFSRVPFVRALIEKSNAETVAKRRLRAGVTIYAESIRLALKQKALPEAVAAAREAVLEKGLFPRSCTVLAPLLHALLGAGEHVEGAALFSEFLGAGAQAAHEDIFDDSLVTVGLRLVVAGPGVGAAEVLAVVSRVPPRFMKRRLLQALLAPAAETGDLALLQAVLKLREEHDVELWDCDYERMLAAIVTAAKLPSGWPAGGPWATSSAATEAILCEMEQHHPVTGQRIIEHLQALSHTAAIEGTVDAATGQCGACGRSLQGYTLSNDDFALLETDIEAKLIRPCFERRSSHYEKDAVTEPLTAAEITQRGHDFDAFVAFLKAHPYDALIDGANVGYFGVCNWYHRAKKDLLVHTGRSPASITASELTSMPLPVDVCPNFEAIESVRGAIAAAGMNPLIILHERHTQPSARLFGTNAAILARWQEEKQVAASPAFLNDDYAWLYACILRRQCHIISNDLMRDHHFQLLSQRSFIRWRQRHRITFKVGGLRPSIRMPCPYSTWTQKSTTTSTSPAADASVSASGSVWHVPFVKTSILHQHTNKARPEGALSKDGDDECDGWLCLALSP